MRVNKMLIQIAISAALLLPAILFDKITGWFWVYMPLYVLSWGVAAWSVAVKAVRNISQGVVFDENFLMLIASVGAFVLSFVFSDYKTVLCAPGGGEIMMDGALVMLLYQIGEYFQSLAVRKSRKGIKQLLSMRPDSAIVERGGAEEEVFPDEVEVGEIIVVRPGDRIAIDGVIESGSSYIDSSAVTGESEPVYRRAGDSVQSGCIASDGLLRIRTTREFGESTASKMLRLVEEASEKKAKQETFITKFAKVYTPIVCALALVIAVIPPLIMTLVSGAVTPDGTNVWGNWIYTALALLVVSCPCALVISVPLTFFGGIGGATKRGVLLKGSDRFSPYAGATVIAFDKTGTITTGKFSVTETNISDEGLRLVAAVESNFTHPIALGITEYVKTRGRCEGAENLAGRGVRGTVDGKEILIGKSELLSERDIAHEEISSPYTTLYAAYGGTYLGYIIVADTVKPSSVEAIAECKRQGLKTVMLTGDRYEVAEAVAREVGIDEFYAGLLPEDKVAKVEELKARGEKVIFCGDGINDAPVLAAADVGCAMGGLGSDAAIEASDAVVMKDDLSSVIAERKHAKKTIAVAMENIIGSLIIKTAVMVLTIVLPYFPLWIAVIADVGVCLLAILNAMRTLRGKVAKSEPPKLTTPAA